MTSLQESEPTDSSQLVPTRADWAEQVLREEILTGRIRPGERIKVRDLVERYPGLSPTPLREALSRLAGSGLVEFVPQRGPRVAPASKDDLHDLYGVRMLLETEALRRSIAAQDREEWLKRVNDSFDRFREASSKLLKSSLDESIGGLVDWEKAHRGFHFALVANCGSRWLLEFIRITYEQSAKYRSYMLGTIRNVNATKEHRRILHAARKGDSDAATSILESHIKITLDHLQTVIE